MGKNVFDNPNPEMNEDSSLDSAAKINESESNETVGGAAEFPEFEETRTQSFYGESKLEFLKDLQLNVYIELGRTQMMIKDIMELERGYVIELDKLASEPVDVFVNNKKIAEGEVVVIDKHFGIRITNLLDPGDRMKGIA